MFHYFKEKILKSKAPLTKAPPAVRQGDFHFLYSFILCLGGFILIFHVPSALHGGFAAAAVRLRFGRFVAHFFLFDFLKNFLDEFVFSFAHKNILLLHWVYFEFIPNRRV